MTHRDQGQNCGDSLTVEFATWDITNSFLQKIANGDPFVYDGVFINPAEVAGAGVIDWADR